MSRNPLQDELSVINVGVESFIDSVTATGAAALHLDWRPARRRRSAACLDSCPAHGRPRRPGSAGSRIDRANAIAVERMLARAAEARRCRAACARGHTGARLERMLLHAGAPVPWEKMCSPMQGSMTGALLYEGWARSADEARDDACARRDPFCAMPRLPGGRADERHHLVLDAGVRGQKRDPRQPRLHQFQRGHRQSAALWRLRRGRDQAAEMDRTGACSRAQACRRRGGGRHRPEEASSRRRC